jgi:hypothetical protein
MGKLKQRRNATSYDMGLLLIAKVKGYLCNSFLKIEKLSTIGQYLFVCMTGCFKASMNRLLLIPLTTFVWPKLKN